MTRHNVRARDTAIVYAGVLPYAFKKTRNGQKLLVLLGKEPSGWSDFGGGREQGETPRRTAAREANEESLMLLGSIGQIMKAVREAEAIRTDRAVHYLHEISYDDDLPRLFKTLRVRLSRSPEASKFPMYLEKTSIQWFPLDRLKEEITLRPHRFRAHFVADMTPNIVHTQ